MRLSTTSILLGEPVWVLVTARNTSGETIQWNPGSDCPMYSQPVTVVIPGAAPGTGKPVRCIYGGIAGECPTGGSTTLAPGASATWEFLLEGNFHFTHPGTYRVELTLRPEPVWEDYRKGGPTLTTPPPTTQTLTLEVLPRDDAALLKREEQMAADADAEFLSSVRLSARAAQSDAWARQELNAEQIDRGLAAQPVPGMELVFVHWLQMQVGLDAEAIIGLKNLNTKASRAALAEIARAPGKPNSYMRESAISALAQMGDRRYYPLMAELLTSPNEAVREAAIEGVGTLGGEAGVAKLAEIARAGTDQNAAMTALGDSDCRAAVKVLVDLLAEKDMKSPFIAQLALLELTHRQLHRAQLMGTPEQAHADWQQWWNAGGRNAPVYTEYECAPNAVLP